ncbi:hypothetical protein [Campylobacter sp.]|uniref:hypothetical protein n=1 Tax=Campylobacter sp. TaxID=205 RepID=UPI00361F4865
MNERAPTYLANRVFNAATDDCLSVQIKSAAAIRLSVRSPAVKFADCEQITRDGEVCKIGDMDKFK